MVRWVVSRKMSAFTLVELLVVLIISSILMTSLYYAYSFFATQVIMLDKKRTQLADLSLFYSTLYKEFQNGSMVMSTGGGFIIHTSDHSIYYTIETNTIQQKVNGVTLELPIDLLSIKYLFENEPVSTNALIDCAIVVFRYQNQQIKWHLIKSYDALTLLNNEKQ